MSDIHSEGLIKVHYTDMTLFETSKTRSEMMVADNATTYAIFDEFSGCDVRECV